MKSLPAAWRFFIFSGFFCLGLPVAYGQTARDSVNTVIHQLFTAMKEADGDAVAALFSDNAVLQTIHQEKTGGATVKNEEISAFARLIAKMQKGDADERITIGAVNIDGPLATAWVPYRFFYKGQFSHCGVNTFQLVRFKQGWKIQYLIDTRRKDACL